MRITEKFDGGGELKRKRKDDKSKGSSYFPLLSLNHINSPPLLLKYGGELTTKRKDDFTNLISKE